MSIIRSRDSTNNEENKWEKSHNYSAILPFKKKVASRDCVDITGHRVSSPTGLSLRWRDQGSWLCIDHDHYMKTNHCLPGGQSCWSGYFAKHSFRPRLRPSPWQVLFGSNRSFSERIVDRTRSLLHLNWFGCQPLQQSCKGPWTTFGWDFWRNSDAKAWSMPTA